MTFQSTTKPGTELGDLGSIVVPSRELMSEVFRLCVRKTRGNIQKLAADPKSCAWAVDGNYFGFGEGFFEIGNWTSSFFTGMALIAWQQEEDEHFLRHTERLSPFYADKVFKHHDDTMHDLGFLYSLYSVALYRLGHDRLHREVGLRAADVLKERFLPRPGCLRAWGRMDSTEFDNMMIVDCLMNLPLLYWAASETGRRDYSSTAVQHADTALRYLVRADGSVYHAYRFDRVTGNGMGGDTYGGCEVESHWARGAAWAIYGFALSYRYTRLPRYLDAALRVAASFVSRLDADGVPVWDFRLPPERQRIRDASAASVAVCGLLEIERHAPGQHAWVREAALRMLGRLCSSDYLDAAPDCPGIQRFGQVGDGTPGGARNAYTSWGDYFLMEALARELFQFETWW